jgi:hypothetical protein
MKMDSIVDLPVRHCNCSCPHWGVEHDHVWVVKCECGEEENVCGYCLQAGRVTACLKCGRDLEAAP